jgi:CHRD domain
VNIDPPIAAHIHVGSAGVAGPVVVPLDPIPGGCVKVDKNLIAAIKENPSNYYLNVHTGPFPAGAIRGQLG